MNLKHIFYKPIGLILHGHSIQGLKDNIERIRKLDWHWGTINRHEPISEIGLKIDFLINYSIDYGGTDFSGIKLKKNKARGNSLQEFLLQCIEDEIPLVHIFGGDGYSDAPSPYFDSFTGTWDQLERHQTDCEHFNATFPKDTGKTKIVNVSKDSHYDLNNISYEEFLDTIPH